MQLTHVLELYPDQSVTQMLFKEVKNAAELRQKAMDGKIYAALINPTMVRFDFLYKANTENVCATCLDLHSR